MSLITPDIGLVFWQTATLLVVLFVLRRFAWGPILEAIQAREEDIETALQRAEVAKKWVSQAQEEREDLLKDAHREHTQIIEEAVATRQTMLQKAEEEAAEVRKKMLAQTNAMLEKEREEALVALKNEVAILTLQIAEKLLKKEFQERGAQEAWVRQRIKEAT